MLNTTITARELKVGDRIDARSRITRVMVRGDQVVAQTKVQGSKAPSVQCWSVDEVIRVGRKLAK